MEEKYALSGWKHCQYLWVNTWEPSWPCAHSVSQPHSADESFCSDITAEKLKSLLDPGDFCKVQFCVIVTATPYTSEENNLLSCQSRVTRNSWLAEKKLLRQMRLLPRSLVSLHEWVEPRHMPFSYALLHALFHLFNQKVMLCQPEWETPGLAEKARQWWVPRIPQIPPEKLPTSSRLPTAAFGTFCTCLLLRTRCDQKRLFLKKACQYQMLSLLRCFLWDTAKCDLAWRQWNCLLQAPEMKAMGREQGLL